MSTSPTPLASSPLKALEVTGVSKTFHQREDRSGLSQWAVSDLSFSMDRGEILGLLGPNGAGKTTTIRMLISVLRPDEGSIRILGKDLAKERSTVLQQVAFASTYTNLPLFLSVQENLDIHGRLYSIPARERQERIEQMLERFGVQDQRKKRVGQLSAGQRTRVMLAKAFLPRPALALLDEPTASLDPDIAAEVRRFVAEERSLNNTAVLFSSHNMTEVTELCDRVIFLKNGRIVAIDTPQHLAATAGESILELDIQSEMSVVHSILLERGLRGDARNRRVSIELREGEEGALLAELAAKGVTYSRLDIRRPTLEDYFLLHSGSSPERTQS